MGCPPAPGPPCNFIRFSSTPPLHLPSLNRRCCLKDPLWAAPPASAKTLRYKNNKRRIVKGEGRRIRTGQRRKGATDALTGGGNSFGYCVCVGWLRPLPPLAQVATDPVVPSWCNPLEAHRCVELVAGLLSASGLPGRGGVRAKEVGVMAPFRKQVYEIRRMLRERGLGRVRVGMVDDFQGQEARVVFISTTLSRVASLREEEEGPQRRGMVGTLLSDVQRFCVAITRCASPYLSPPHPSLAAGKSRSWWKSSS